MDAKKARSLVDEKRNIGEIFLGVPSVLRAKADGYLLALEGPEVKALVQIADATAEFLEERAKNTSQDIPFKYPVGLRAAVAAFREAVKP